VIESDRPDPDALLASLKRDEVRARRGSLKVFFGMCPGVGKTYAMLRSAQQELGEGIDLAVGVVETHGRAETEALLVGLPVIPRKQIIYKNIQLTEMDLEAILARKPRLVLVDEFAHTNAPGSRHPKRYQDVIELLDAGIDVHTTLNVQHIESRADAVRQITGATVHETVPDSVFGLADQIELVDITPEALRERLSEGKVYMDGRAAAAAENFFKDTHLTALRELALRFVAENVDKRLRELRSATALKTVWRSGERLLVAVGPSPSSTQLVRWTRRMAASQGASWIAVSVEGSRTLENDALRRLEQNLALARELGAEIVVTHDDDVADALVRVALQNNATQIVVGKSLRPRWLDALRGGNLVDRLLHKGGTIDIYVVPAERAAEKPHTWIDWRPVEADPAREYAEVFGTLAALTAASWLLLPRSDYLSVGLFYLLAIIGLSLRVGRGPIFVAGVASALAWDFLFIPPIFTFVIAKLEDRLMFGTFFVVALISGHLTSRIRAQERNERMREDRATALFHLTQAISSARTLDDAVFAALRQADAYFGAKSALLYHGEGARRRRLGVAQPQEGRPLHRHAPLRRGIPRAAHAGGRRPRGPHPAPAARLDPHACPARPRRELRNAARAAGREGAASRGGGAREAAGRVRQAPPHAARRRVPRAKDAACGPERRRREPRLRRRADARKPRRRDPHRRAPTQPPREQPSRPNPP